MLNYFIPKTKLISITKPVHEDLETPEELIAYTARVSNPGNQLNNENFQVLVNLSEMLQDSVEVGEMEFDVFKFYIKSLETYEKNLVVCKTN